MAKLTERTIEVEAPHEFKGEEFVSVVVLSKYDNGASYPKTHNFPKALVPALAAKLNAVVKTL